MILGLIVIAVFMLVYKIRTAYKDLNVHQKGSERWTTLDEIKQQYRSVPEKGKEFLEKAVYQFVGSVTKFISMIQQSTPLSSVLRAPVKERLIHILQSTFTAGQVKSRPWLFWIQSLTNIRLVITHLQSAAMMCTCLISIIL